MTTIQTSKDILARIDARLIDTDQALLVAAKLEIERISADYRELSKLFYEVVNSQSEFTPEIEPKIMDYVNKVYK